jgi:hypothetical protein
MPTNEPCEYCDSQNATTHCSECGKALCVLCQIKDEDGKIKCLSCSEVEVIPLTDEDVEDKSLSELFERQDDE